MSCFLTPWKPAEKHEKPPGRTYSLTSWLLSLYSNSVARIYRLKGYLHFSSMVYDGRLVLLRAVVKLASWLRVRVLACASKMN